ncbi:hypothetical protein [Rugamonas sp.]|uniref:hypothetical protein n=1 Tax=Rugamonas sp. TaxID=1926287 RepID=UPI0025F54A8A|nr:hypothetical protein [Rugamonas sp.]
MFILKSEADKTITWPVKVDVPTNNGKITQFEFSGIFKRLSDDEREALIADAAIPTEDSTPGPNAWKAASVDNIMKMMTGWKSVVDEDKQPIEFTRENLLAGARGPNGFALLRALNTALNEIATGARAKN